MAKAKNKRKNLAEHVNNKKKSQNAKTLNLNPFEIHINKEKMKVLGRKLKNDRGLPGVSRTKAIKKRKGTLLQEYKLQNKSNKFIDKRIGERNMGLTEEDRAMARFTAVRAKVHKKKSIFNLADDEVLTHRGQTLNEIEKFDDPRSDDEDSEDELMKSGKLDSEFVEDAHFGGGILTRTGIDGAKSHKDLINQLIAESKRRKAEKQMAKEKTLELTEKLDSEWKDLIPLVNKNSKESTKSAKPDVDSYDKAIRELRFEARGHPSDRLKTEDELAKEEKEKLEKLENDRLSRMKGIFEKNQPTNTKHRSADDLEDDFAYDPNLDPDVMLSYNEKGESNIVDEQFNTEAEAGNEKEMSEEEESADEAETASEDDLSDLKEESDNENDETDNDISENEAVEESNSEIEIPKNIPNTDSTNNEVEQDSSEISNIKTKQENIKTDLLKRKEIMDKARRELPFTFNLPESYTQLQEIYKNQSPEHQSVILERMMKCNHPSLNETNKEKLGMLFIYLLQYISDITAERIDIKEGFKILNYLIPQLFDLAQFNQENTHQSMREVIKEKQMEYRRKKKAYPGVDILFYLKIISCLFPTSDFRQQVVTPSVVFIEQMLRNCKVRTKMDISYGLFLVTLILEYTTLSKRYLPAAINFLAGIVHMSIPKSGIKLIKVLPPFKSTSSTLVLFKNCSSLNLSLKLEVNDLTDTEISEDFKIRSLSTCLKLLSEFKENFKEFSSAFEIFSSVFKYLEQIPRCNYPEEVQNEIVKLLNDFDKLKTEKELEYIVMAVQKPKALRLYEPNIQKVYDGKKRRIMSREKADHEKLLHKIKKEKKGALREIRRDTAFLGRVKIKRQIEGDRQREEKVKRIFAEANIQQSELNSMDRKKKRR